MNLSICILIALLLDYTLGEPRRGHPLILFGQLATYLENRLSAPTNNTLLKQRLAGGLAVTIAVIPILLVVLLINEIEYLVTLLASVILYFCIAANSLEQHTLAVYSKLQENNPEQAKANLALIVSRETDNMDELAIRKATIESALENGADAIFAPLFWFIIAGPLGAIGYRMINTLDAMWGYKTPRHRHFGWFAARLDDCVNWIPARLTALSYALLGNTRHALLCWQQQAHKCDSPNAGPVMTAGAGALNLQLGGVAVYHGQRKQKPELGCGRLPTNYDIKRANLLIKMTLLTWTVTIIIGEFIV
jgi:adenosylcobinamide-phosphate synthase